MSPTNGPSDSASRRSIRSSALAGSMIEDAIVDLRFALRGPRRKPTFTAVSAVTIAVGIGATSAMLRIANAVLLRQPPILEPARMVAIWEDRSGSVRNGPAILLATLALTVLTGVLVGLAAARDSARTDREE